jgi:hypothetical protein
VLLVAVWLEEIMVVLKTNVLIRIELKVLFFFKDIDKQAANNYEVFYSAYCDHIQNTITITICLL